MQEEWKVYYNGNFGKGHRKRFRPGTEIKLEKWAFWKDVNVFVPAVYSCSQGLVISHNRSKSGSGKRVCEKI